jgi:hypothetical protein
MEEILRNRQEDSREETVKSHSKEPEDDKEQ